MRFFIIIVSLLFSLGLSAAEYKVAVRTNKGIDAAASKWQPTIDVLNSKFSEDTFILEPIVSLDEITRRVGHGDFDFVLTNPSSYVEIEKLHGAKALVTLNNKRGNTAQDQFGSVIFTHAKNKNILSISDLKNKKLMAVVEPAFGGWRVAWLEMLENDFNPYRELKELLFTKSGTQPEVVRAVLDQKVDAGVVRTDLLERMEEAGEIDMRYLRIINNKDVKDFPFFLSTKLYPEWAFSVSKSLPPEVEEKVRKTLLGIRPNSAAAKTGKYINWISPRDYSSVQKLMKRLKVGPFEN